MSRIKEIKYVIGDLHFGDDGMFNRAYNKAFATKEIYIEEVIKNYNSVVNDNTVVLFLGDLGRTGLEHIHKMKGYKILIKGNHDNNRNQDYIDAFEEVYDHPIFYSSRYVFSHEPIPTEPGVINIHGHTHAVSLKSERHFNYVIERTNYRPVSMKSILKIQGTIAKPNRRFCHEWFKDIMITSNRERDDIVFDENGLIDAAKSLIKMEELRNK